MTVQSALAGEAAAAAPAAGAAGAPAAAGTSAPATGGAATPTPAATAAPGAPAGAPTPAATPGAAEAKAPDAKAADAATTDKATAEKAAAELAAAAKALEIKLPDGFQEDAHFGKFRELAAKLGMKSEGAQALVDLFVSSQTEQAKAAEDTRLQAIERVSLDYENQLKADKVYGGEKHAQTVQDARKAIRMYGDPATVGKLKERLAQSVWGNDPDLVKLLANVGRRSAEGKLEGTTSEGGRTAGNSNEAFHRALYPRTFEQHWDKKH